MYILLMFIIDYKRWTFVLLRCSSFVQEEVIRMLMQFMYKNVTASSPAKLLIQARFCAMPLIS